ncbi:hypothetical protein LCGC14_0395430 [marine sediment metagenome]|uniref:Uncharacterized protein n=1 Tax=marine sediment metagenome TaxID=412755 RepID=A0A0F9TGE4_9ZZZZ
MSLLGKIEVVRNKKEPTIKQRWARERNLAIGNVQGMVVRLYQLGNLDSMTYTEQVRLCNARSTLMELLSNHEENRDTSWHDFKIGG